MSRVVEFLSKNPEFFPKYRAWKDVTESKLKFPAFAQVKYDGVNMCLVVEDSNFYAISRQGKEFKLPIKIEDILKIGNLCDGIYIGEFIVSNLSCAQISGIVNPNRVKELSADVEQLVRRESTLYLFDFYDLSIIDGVKDNRTYSQRLNTLYRLNLVNAPVAQTLYVESLEAYNNFHDEQLLLGAEGTILKSDDVSPDTVRSHSLVKRVKDLSVDLECLGIKAGEGKREGLVGSLLFHYKGRDFYADLGKGWDDSKRAGLNSDNPIGKVFRVTALGETNKGSLRLPKVLEERIDKTIQDT